ncbi:MAG: adenosylcobinamide-phosphate synthase CbiB [Chloroflexi bacterium]|nr:adenosylcobinamide-phosphate synthase CbiB [Chloroflexota bacterium]MCY3937074.1 adenosylcobinamide-phosphate synthase CbiB [Chloroflexota bacterium]
MFTTWWNDLALNAAVFLLAIVLDRLLPEPPNKIHPVVWMGHAIAALQRIAPQRPAAAFLFGGAVVVVVAGGTGVLAWLLVTALMSAGPLAYAVGAAIMLRTSFTVRGLLSAADQTRRALAEDRLNDARASLRSLVSRDPTSLMPSLVAASAVESLAENTTDSYVGPWLAFAVFGVPGAIAYRAINTLDSMLGYRGAYEYLGKVPARLDDVVNLVPARISALLILAAGALGRLSVRRGWRVMLRDRGRTASPNAGLTMSAMAGLLGIQLEKPGHYRLGEGLRKPVSGDIGRAMRIVQRTALLSAVATVGLLYLRHVIAG